MYSLKAAFVNNFKQADDTTDSGNIENELFMVLYRNSTDGHVHLFLATSCEGLYEAFQGALK